MSIVAHYLHKWKIRLGILVALVCLWPIQTWLINAMTTDALNPYRITLTLPLSDALNQDYGLSPDAKVNKVFVSGSFSDWYSDDPYYQMQPVSANQWQYDLSIHPGDIEYKLVLHLDGQPTPIWILDPNNPETASNPWGDANSLLHVLDWPKIATTVQLFTLSIVGAFLLFCVLEPFLYWLLHLKMPFHRKLMISNMLILICAQVVFFGYQLHQSRQLIKLSVSDTLHNMHLLLASEQIDFDNIADQQQQISTTIERFFLPQLPASIKNKTAYFKLPCQILPCWIKTAN